MDSKIKIAVLGCGNRSYYVVNNLLMDSNKEVEVVSAYDPDSSELERALEHWNAPNACRAACSRYAASARKAALIRRTAAAGSFEISESRGTISFRI